MKATTLYQPWATLVAIKAKGFETRSWAIKHRGPIAIHAAKTFPRWAKDLCKTEPFRSVLSLAGYTVENLPLGKVVAIAEVKDCVQMTRDNMPPEPERSFGHYEPGHYFWKLGNVKPIDPIAATGAQGLWNWYKRTLTISDIHGFHKRFLAVLGAANYDPLHDKLVMLGDYIDRGPNSKEVLAKIKELVEAGATALLGNHEWMLLEVYEGRLSIYDWLRNGGKTTLESYGVESIYDLPREDIAFMKKLPTTYETKQHIFVHAGINPDKPLLEQALFDLLWIRDNWLNSDYTGKSVVFGHTPSLDGVAATAHKIMVDTGAAYGGKLTLVDLTTLTTYAA